MTDYTPAFEKWWAQHELRGYLPGVDEKRMAYRGWKGALDSRKELCACGVNRKEDCGEEWGPRCDLGNNPEYTRIRSISTEEWDAVQRSFGASGGDDEPTGS